MFCQNCGHQAVDENTKFCAECGFGIDGPKLTHVDAHHKTNRRFSGKTPTSKFIILHLATFGIYPLFWMYDQWDFLKKKQHLNISPGWRAFFSTLWAGALAGEVQRFLKKENISVSYNSIVIGVSFFILSILYKLPDPYWPIAFLSFVSILPILDAMNHYYEENESHLSESKLSWWQIALVILGLITLASVIYELMYP